MPDFVNEVFGGGCGMMPKVVILIVPAVERIYSCIEIVTNWDTAAI